MLKLVLIPPQGFGSEAKTRGGILGEPANKNLQNGYTVYTPEKKNAICPNCRPNYQPLLGKMGPRPAEIKPIQWGHRVVSGVRCTNHYR